MGHKSLEVLVPNLNSKSLQEFREPNLNLSSHGKWTKFKHKERMLCQLSQMNTSCFALEIWQAKLQV